jgi:hypothetical protein
MMGAKCGRESFKPGVCCHLLLDDESVCKLQPYKPRLFFVFASKIGSIILFVKIECTRHHYYLS